MHSSFIIPTLFELGHKKNDFRHMAISAIMAAHFLAQNNPLQSNKDDITSVYDFACDELVMKTKSPGTVKDIIQESKLSVVHQEHKITLGNAIAQMIARTSANGDAYLGCILTFDSGKAVCVVGRDQDGFIALNPSENRIYTTTSPEYGIANINTNTICDVLYVVLEKEVEEDKEKEEENNGVKPMVLEKEKEEEEEKMKKPAPKKKTSRRKSTTTTTTKQKKTTTGKKRSKTTTAKSADAPKAKKEKSSE